VGCAQCERQHWVFRSSAMQCWSLPLKARRCRRPIAEKGQLV
jgi:hypothetical protein